MEKLVTRNVLVENLPIDVQIVTRYNVAKQLQQVGTQSEQQVSV